MISQETIDQVRDLPLPDAISKYINLEKSGANWKCKSPFTDEKSASFQVSGSKNVWKCFSTGKGGKGIISFVMAHKLFPFYDAVISIAETNNIIITYDDSDFSKERFLKTEKVQQLNDINQVALEHFQEHLSELEPKFKRATDEMSEKFQLGYAPNDFQSLLNFLLKKGFSNKQMLDAGLIKCSDKGKHYDFFRGRVVFPVHDWSGKLTGFSGRLAVDIEEGKPEPTKVLNSKETEAFQKSRLLLGLFEAKKDIEQSQKAIVVEGNYDVTSMHQEGLTNTVATIGSAFTDDHAKQLKRFAKNVCFAVDNDKAGIDKIEKNTYTALRNDLHATLFIPETAGMDPDDLCKARAWGEGTLTEYFQRTEKDAIDYLADLYFTNAITTVEQSKAEQRLVDLLACMSDGRLRNKYVAKYAKEYKISKTDVEKSIGVSIASRNAEEPGIDGKTKLPGYLTADDLHDWNKYGFFQDSHKDKIGYYFPTQGSMPERVSNFIIKALFQVKGQADSKRFVEIKNSDKTAIVELSNMAMVSKLEFDKIITNEGDFWFYGQPKHFQRVKVKLLGQFPFCTEIRTLGWHYNGFFSFANGVVENGVFKPADNFGIINHTDQRYFLPAFSSIYREASAEDDFYENDRKFVFKTHGIGFKGWANKFLSVYKDNHNGMIAISFVVASLFSDYIFAQNNDFPILFMFGQPRTGKTTCARSVSRVFKADTAPFNLNQGTVIGFQRRLARVRNVVEHLDEYQNDLDEKRFQSLKGIYDRTGHEKGLMTRDNRTESVKINTPVVISGQHLPTRDGNSLFTRIILLQFSKMQDMFTNEEIEEFNNLAAIEKKGLSDVIIEIIRYRDLIERDFNEYQFNIGSKLKDEFEGKEFDGRVAKNFVVLMTCVKILQQSVEFPFTYDFFYEKCKEMILVQSQQISESDQLAEFFGQIEFLSLQKMISEGDDYKIESTDQVTVGRGDRQVIKNYDVSKKVLYLKFAKIFPLYKESLKRQGGSPLDQQTIINYMKGHKAFIGGLPVVNFNGHKTSGYAFDYEMLNVSLAVVDADKYQVPVVPFHEPKQSSLDMSDKRPEKKDDDLPF